MNHIPLISAQNAYTNYVLERRKNNMTCPRNYLDINKD